MTKSGFPEGRQLPCEGDCLPDRRLHRAPTNAPMEEAGAGRRRGDSVSDLPADHPRTHIQTRPTRGFAGLAEGQCYSVRGAVLEPGDFKRCCSTIFGDIEVPRDPDQLSGPEVSPGGMKRRRNSVKGGGDASADVQGAAATRGWSCSRLAAGFFSAGFSASPLLSG